MFNLVVFLVSVVGLTAAFALHDDWNELRCSLSHIKRFLILSLLFCPFNTNGDIYTVFGSAKSEGNIYSVFSPYQSGKNTHALFGSFYQKAEENAGVVFGIAGLQQANHNAIVMFGIATIQEAGHDAIGGLTGVIYQEAGRHAGSVMVAYQSAAYRSDAGFAGYQKAGTASRYFGLLSSLGELPKDEVKK